MEKDKIIIITGPTATGKSNLAIQAALELNGEIINADSLAVYKKFNIGTAKPTAKEQNLVKHHLIDILEPDEDYNAAEFLTDAKIIIKKLRNKKIPIIAGGTGFYIRSLTMGLFKGPGHNANFRTLLESEILKGLAPYKLLEKKDPISAQKINENDLVRIERALEVFYSSGQTISLWQHKHNLQEKNYNALSIVLDRPKEEMEERFLKRTQIMLQNGLIEEVENLLKEGWDKNLKPFKSIGYKEVIDYLENKTTLKELENNIITATRQFAKRQRTWFKGQMPQAIYFHPNEEKEILKTIKEFLQS